MSDVGGECRTSGIVWRRCQGGVSDVGDSVVLSDVVGLGGGERGDAPGPGPEEHVRGGPRSGPRRKLLLD